MFFARCARRTSGINVFAETSHSNLLLSIEELERPDFEGAEYVLTPPLAAPSVSAQAF